MVQAYATNLLSLIEDFGSDEDCRTYLEALRWPNGIACLKCGSLSVTRLPKRRLLQCADCRYQFSVTTGTIMHDSHLPLRKWLLAVYLMVEAKKGISANQLKRTLNVGYQTAWYLEHRIRKALTTEGGFLRGIVEIDETYVGGKARGRRYRDKKTVVLGAKQRGGSIRLQTGKNVKRKTLREFIQAHIAPDAEAIYTDDATGYWNMTDADTRHERVNHSAEEWVRGDVHTNSIEGAWALFKRSLVGSYHKVSKKHLDAYLDEFEFRFNNRNNPYIFRDALTELLTAGPLEYRQLTAAAE